MKAIFNTIRATFIEYKDSVDKIDKEKDSVFQTRSMEISIKEVEERNKKWQEDFRAFIEEQIKSINDNYEGLITKAKDQISSLSFEITKLNYTLNDEKQNYLSPYACKSSDAIRMKREKWKNEFKKNTV